MNNANGLTLEKTLNSLLEIYRHKEINIIQTIKKVEDDISTLKNEMLIQEQSLQKHYSVIKQCIVGIDQAASIDVINKNKINIDYIKNKIAVVNEEKKSISAKVDDKLIELDQVKKEKIKICKKIYKYELIYEDQETASRKEQY